MPATIKTQDGVLGIRYSRFSRIQTSELLRIELHHSSGTELNRRIWISRTLLERIRIQKITPAPSRQISAPERVEFEFDLSIPQGATAAIDFHYDVNAPGNIQGRLGQGDSRSLDFRQFVFP